MSTMITTTVLKPHMGQTGFVHQVGAVVTVDEQRHRALVKKGYVENPDGEIAPAAREPRAGITNADFELRREQITGGTPTPKPEYEAMTNNQLKALAAERSIDLGDATKKADIIAALELSDEEGAKKAG
jgi:hypothetical protein